MKLFGKRSEISLREYEKLQKELLEIRLKFEEFENKLAILKTNMNSLRGLVNNRFSKTEEEDDETSKKFGMFVN